MISWPPCQVGSGQPRASSRPSGSPPSWSRSGSAWPAPPHPPNTPTTPTGKDNEYEQHMKKGSSLIKSVRGPFYSTVLERLLHSSFKHLPLDKGIYCICFKYIYFLHVLSYRPTVTYRYQNSKYTVVYIIGFPAWVYTNFFIWMRTIFSNKGWIVFF